MGKILKGDVAFVTGACGGIGSALCAALSNAGATVVATDQRDSARDLVCDAYIQHDVTSAQQWQQVIGKVEGRYGRLDILINNAGTAIIGSIADTTIEAWRRVQSVNVESILLGLHAAADLLRQSGAARVGGAAVVNMSSIAGLRGGPMCSAYSASKGAVKILSKCAAIEYAALGYPIRVNSVHPGATDTEMLRGIRAASAEQGAAASPEAADQERLKRYPLGRLGTPEEVAGGVVYLCSPAASYVTGAELTIDGGLTAAA